MINPLSSLPNYGTRTNEITLYAGPCSVESEEQFNEVAECIAGLGLTWIRGGAFKPRTNPHSFQGLGEEGLQIMKAGAEKYGLKTLTEVMDSAHCEMVHSYVDGLQIGARNMQNFSLLKNVGKVTAQSHKMVLLKRGLAGSISEWLSATEYLTMGGNDNIVLCERGLRTFETATRFTLDISAVPVIHKQSIFPICVDVSHPAGVRDLVPSLAYAAVAAGCDSIMIEVHPNPTEALSDGPQQLTPAQFTELVTQLREIALSPAGHPPRRPPAAFPQLPWVVRAHPRPPPNSRMRRYDAARRCGGAGNFQSVGAARRPAPSSFKSSALATAPLAVLLAHIWTLERPFGRFFVFG